MGQIADRLASQLQPTPNEPLWTGPNGEGANGGVTQGLLSRFLCCRERFRLRVMEGLGPVDQFNHRLEYGNLWHACKEAHAGNQPWEPRLAQEVLRLTRKYKTAIDQVQHWHQVCRTQFPIYLNHWAKHPSPTKRVPLMEEGTFDLEYTLPSRRVVRLRGKYDGVAFYGLPGRLGSGVFLDEDKTKGDVKESQLVRQLSFDLQTMFYLTALERDDRVGKLLRERVKHPEANSQPVGVVYDVVRRPLSGGKGNISRHKAKEYKNKFVPEETPEEFYARLSSIIAESPQEFFFRWEVLVTRAEIEKFREQCLNPILEQLCDWWQWVSFITARGGSVWDNDVSFGGRPDLDDNGTHCSAIHWRHPFGVYNVLDEGGSSDVDEFLATGSEAGLERTGVLFPELKE